MQQQFETPSEALAHYGVKGMKWGVRKEDPTSTRTTSPAAKKPASGGSASYSIDNEGRITIEKGSHIQRVFQTGKGGDGSQGANYFSFTERDKNTYLMMMGAGIDSRFSIIRKLASDKVSVMVAKEELRSPSRKEAFDVLQKTIADMGPASKMKPFEGDFFKDGALEWYQDANTRIVLDKGTNLHRTYLNNLRKDGYNILLDEMDAGTMSDLPIVVLDGSKSLKPLSISDVQGQDVRAAKALIKQHKDWTIKDLEEHYGSSGKEF